MSRENILLTKQNDLWLLNQVKSLGDYANKSELVNELIRQARRAEITTEKLATKGLCDCGEQSVQDMLDEFKLLLSDINTFQVN